MAKRDASSTPPTKKAAAAKRSKESKAGVSKASARKRATHSDTPRTRTDKDDGDENAEDEEGPHASVPTRDHEGLNAEDGGGEQDSEEVSDSVKDREDGDEVASGREDAAPEKPNAGSKPRAPIKPVDVLLDAAEDKGSESAVGDARSRSEHDAVRLSVKIASGSDEAVSDHESADEDAVQTPASQPSSPHEHEEADSDDDHRGGASPSDVALPKSSRSEKAHHSVKATLNEKVASKAVLAEIAARYREAENFCSLFDDQVSRISTNFPARVRRFLKERVLPDVKRLKHLSEVHVDAQDTLLSKIETEQHGLDKAVLVKDLQLLSQEAVDLHKRSDSLESLVLQAIGSAKDGECAWGKSSDLIMMAHSALIKITGTFRNPEAVRLSKHIDPDQPAETQLLELLQHERESNVARARPVKRLMSRIARLEHEAAEDLALINKLDVELGHAKRDLILLRDSRVFEIMKLCEGSSPATSKRSLREEEKLPARKKPRFDEGSSSAKSNISQSSKKSPSTPDAAIRLMEEEDYKRVLKNSTPSPKGKLGTRFSRRDHASTKSLIASTNPKPMTSSINLVDSSDDGGSDDAMPSTPPKEKNKKTAQSDSDGAGGGNQTAARSSDASDDDFTLNENKHSSGRKLLVKDLFSPKGSKKSSGKVKRPAVYSDDDDSSQESDATSSSKSALSEYWQRLNFWSGRADRREVAFIELVFSQFKPPRKLGRSYSLGKVDRVAFFTFLELNPTTGRISEKGVPSYVKKMEDSLPEPATFSLAELVARSKDDKSVQDFLTSFRQLRSPEMLLAAWECTHYLPLGKGNFYTRKGLKQPNCNESLDLYVKSREARYDTFRYAWTTFATAVSKLADAGIIPYRTIVDPTIPCFNGRLVWVPTQTQMKSVAGLTESVEAVDDKEPQRIWFLDSLKRHPFYRNTSKR